MRKDSFLDANVIINYANYQKDKSKEIVNKCYLYISNKQNKFILCYAVIRELFNTITKLTIIHIEVLKKVDNINYQLGKDKALPVRYLPIAEKLYLAHKEVDKNKLKELFASERDIFEIEIEKFLKNKVDIRAIPIEEIKADLISSIRDIIENYADCQILASALQYQKDKDLFLFVTADGKDFSPNSYEYLKKYFNINYSKENYKFPELLNLMFQ